MSKIEDALRRLTPEQRALLERRLQQKRQHKSPAQEQIGIRSDRTSYPLSAGQQRLLALELLYPNTPQYNITVAHRLMGPVDVDVLNRSIRLVLERHEVLRARYVYEAGAWLQFINELPEKPIKGIDLAHLPATKRLRKAISYVHQDLRTPFDLAEGPLNRMTLIKLADNDYVFFATIHHAACDAWSFDIFLKEITAHYEALLNQEKPDVPEISIQYADYASWQQIWLESDRAQEQLDYWKEAFKDGATPVKLPADHPLATKQSIEGASLSIVIPEALTEALKNLSLNEKLTPFTIFLTAFKSLLYRYTDQEELVVCAPIAGRRRMEVEPLIGYFNNLLALRTNLVPEESFKTLAERIGQQAMAASDHQEIPFEVIADMPSLRRTSLTGAFFTFQNALSHSFQLPGVEIDAIELESPSADFDLSFFVEQKGEDVVVVAEYKAQLFEKETIDRLLQNYLELLNLIAANPHLQINALPRFEMPEQSHPQVPDVSAAIHETDDVPEDEEAKSPDVTLTVNAPSPGGDALPSSLPVKTSTKKEPLAAPNDDIEQILTRIWERSLGIKGIDPHDNFFELGGHSLMAVNMFGEIQKYIGNTELPLAALLESPTIASLAHRIREGDGLDWSPLAIIQAGRGSIPIFCIHGAGGNVLLYRDLAIQLGPNQTVYGLQSQGMDGKRPILTRIEDMAALYVKAIRKAYPSGPYLLVGYCMGGTVALEMAQILRKQGQKVEMLAMLETYNWAFAPKESFFVKLRYLYQKLKFHLGNYYLLSKQDRKLFKAEKMAELKRRRKVWYGKMAVKLRPKKMVPKGGDVINHRALAEVWRTNDIAAERYKPQEYPGRVMHFLPMEEYTAHKYQGMSWDGIVYDVETHILSVYPAGMLIEPFVKELAQALRAEVFRITQRLEDEDDADYEAEMNPLQLTERTSQ